jgi:thiamine monophosphate synthase
MTDAAAAVGVDEVAAIGAPPTDAMGGLTISRLPVVVDNGSSE